MKRKPTIIDVKEVSKTGFLKVNLFSALFLLISIFVFINLNQILQAQTLKFSKVILLSSQQTVPNDHVWKIESCMGPRTYTGGGSATNTAPNEHLILINSTSISVATNGYGSVSTVEGSEGYYKGSKTEVCTTMPIWLPAGTIVNISTNVNFISIVDFELIP